MSTLQLENIKHPDASGNALELGADGSITNNVVISGNVGIGTVPASGVELHVASADYPYVRTTATGYTGIDFGQNSDNGEGLIKLRDSADLSFWTGDVRRVSITSQGYVLTPDQPAFRAYLSTEWTTISAYVNSGWTAQYNRANSFNQGTFTAPVSGVYSFTVMWDALSTQSRLDLALNGGWAVRYEPTGLDNNSWESHHYSTEVYMAAGDYVSLYVAGGSGPNPVHMGSSYWGFFCGHLIG